MAPEDRLVGRRGPPDGPGIDAVVEEHDQGGAPVPADRMRGVPPPRPSHLVGGEVEGVDLGLGQVVSAGDVALVPGRGEPRRRVDQLLLPGPVEDGAEVLAGLVGRAAGVLSLIRDGLLVDPVEELADVLAPQLLDGDAAAPLLPLPEGREVLVARGAGQGLGAQVALRCRLEGRRHHIGPGAADPCPAARPVRGDHPRTCWSDSELINRAECAPGDHGIRPRRDARLTTLPIAASRTPARVPDCGVVGPKQIVRATGRR